MSAANAIRVLLVEDSPTDARLLQLNLGAQQQQNFEVTWVERMADAIARLRSHSFDVCLLDLTLPDSAGMATFTNFHDAAPGLPVIVLTGASGEAGGVNAIRRGAQDFLSKNATDAATVARSIRYAVERKRAEVSTNRLNAELERRVEEVETGNRALRDSHRAALNLMEDAVEARTQAERAVSGLRESESRFRLLAETAGELLRSATPQKDVVALCQRVMEHLDCHVFFNFLLDEETGRLHLNASAGISSEQARAIEWLDYGVAVCGCVAAEGCPIVAEHIPATPDPRTELVKSYGVKAYACHPLLAEGGRVVGTLSFGTKSREVFSPDDLSLMQAVTDQVAAAMVRMQNEQALLASREELEQRVRERTSELALSAERFRLALSNGAIMVASTDTQLRFTWIHSPSLGFDATLAVGKRPENLWPGANTGCLTAFLGTVMASGRGSRVELPLRLPSEDRVFDVLAEPLRSTEGEVVGLTMAALDITERKRLEAQLLQAQKMEAVGRLAGGIAHDFNNMMQVVTGYAQRLLRQLPPEDAMRGHVERIKEAGESAAALTQQLLALGRKQILQLAVLDINAVIAGMEQMLRRTLGDDVIVVTRLQPALHPVKVDAVQLQQVIMNLALNARDAMAKGGSLTLETANVELAQDHPYGTSAVPPGPYVMLAVSDTGCGMDKETQLRIFDPFFTTKAPGRGTGLGLSMVFGTVEQSGGAIRVYSAPGAGTTFKIFLPPSPEPVPAAQSAPRADAPGGRETLLVVEDNRKVREFAAAELVDLGYRVLQARDGPEALATAEGHDGPIHLLLADVMMPGMTGREVSDKITVARPEMKTLFMSGHAEDHIVERGVLLPGTRFLAKPYTPSQLAAKIREVLGSASGPARASAKTRTRARRPATALQRVLVVDDVPGVAEVIAHVLADDGYATSFAEDGRSALDLAARIKPHAVLLDIGLPDMDGYELARRLCQFGLKPKPLLIATRGLSSDEHAQKCKAAGIDECLVKPVDFVKLRAILAAGLRS